MKLYAGKVSPNLRFNELFEIEVLEGFNFLASEIDSETPVHSSAAPISNSVSYGPSTNGSALCVSKPATQDQWDRGEVNYTGGDRFHNIQRHLDDMINKNKNLY